MTELNKREEVKKHLEGEIGKLEANLEAYNGSDVIMEQINNFGNTLKEQLSPKPMEDDYERIREGFGRNKRTYVKVGVTEVVIAEFYARFRFDFLCPVFHGIDRQQLPVVLSVDEVTTCKPFL